MVLVIHSRSTTVKKPFPKKVGTTKKLLSSQNHLILHIKILKLTLNQYMIKDFS